jgi:hypothetical protein
MTKTLRPVFSSKTAIIWTLPLPIPQPVKSTAKKQKRVKIFHKTILQKTVRFKFIAYKYEELVTQSFLEKNIFGNV